MKITLLESKDARELFEFERRNKDFFELCLPPREERYHSLDGVKNIIGELLEEHKRDLSHMYLIWDGKNNLIGRVNIFDIEDHSAEIGYRIGEGYQGMGYASKAVKLICREAFDRHNIKTLLAGTSTKNYASQKVLMKNSFTLIDEVEEVMEINGILEDGLLFQKTVSEA